MILKQSAALAAMVAASRLCAVSARVEVKWPEARKSVDAALSRDDYNMEGSVLAISMRDLLTRKFASRGACMLDRYFRQRAISPAVMSLYDKELSPMASRRNQAARFRLAHGAHRGPRGARHRGRHRYRACVFESRLCVFCRCDRLAPEQRQPIA